MKLIEYICWGIVYFTFIVGVFTLTIGSHELKHYFDIKDLNEVEVNHICFLNIPLSEEGYGETGIGGYVHYISEGYVPYTSEAEAYLVCGIVAIIIFLSYFKIVSILE